MIQQRDTHGEEILRDTDNRDSTGKGDNRKEERKEEGKDEEKGEGQRTGGRQVIWELGKTESILPHPISSLPCKHELPHSWDS